MCELLFAVCHSSHGELSIYVVYVVGRGGSHQIEETGVRVHMQPFRSNFVHSALPLRKYIKSC